MLGENPKKSKKKLNQFSWILVYTLCNEHVSSSEKKRTPVNTNRAPEWPDMRRERKGNENGQSPMECLLYRAVSHPISRQWMSLIMSVISSLSLVLSLVSLSAPRPLTQPFIFVLCLSFRNQKHISVSLKAKMDSILVHEIV